MKIKTRILLYNTLMVLLSLIALLMIGSFVIGLRGRRNSNNSLENTIAQSVELMDSIISAESFDEADDSFEEIGYTLYVFSSPSGELSPSASPLIESLHGYNFDSAEAFTVSGYNIVVRQMPPYLLIAVRNEMVPQNELSVRSLLIAFLTVGGIAIAVILSIGYLLTRNLLKYISKPLDALSRGAGRVELGDLSQPIDYRSSDEFKSVCDSFDRMQQHLKRERDKNAAYEKARTDLVTGISHDLRTPLTSVKGYIKGIQDGIANTPEKVERYLQTAYAKAGEMDILLQRLFFFSKVETGNLPLNKKVTDLGDLVRYYVDEASLDPQMQNVTFLTDMGEAPHYACVDSHQLRRVFNNLTENAIKYSSVSSLKVRISLYSENDCHIITFSDNGRGVKNSMLPYIFEQFWRGDSARKEGGNSSGLGLYIVKYIIDSHGGSIKAENDGGLKLIIRLPSAKEEHQ